MSTHALGQTTSQSATTSQPIVLATADGGNINISGTMHPVILELTTPPTSGEGINVIPQNPTFPNHLFSGGSATFTPGAGDWQYGVTWYDIYYYFGGFMNITAFNGNGNPNALGYWLGFFDDKNNFIQEGFSYWGSPIANGNGCYQYTAWAVDSYSSNQLRVGNCPPLTNGQYYLIGPLTSGWENLGTVLINGQWYYYFAGSIVNTGWQPYPGGADSATRVRDTLGAKLEGGPGGTYTSGWGFGSWLMYIWNVYEQGGTYYYQYSNPPNAQFGDTAPQGQSGGPPYTAWYVTAGTCPYDYSQWFQTNDGSLPSTGTNEPACYTS